MDVRTEKANLLLMDAKKLLESVRKSNSSDEDSFALMSLSLTPPSNKLKNLEINNDEECNLSPMTHTTNLNQSHDDVTVDTSLLENDNQTVSTLQTTSHEEAMNILTETDTNVDISTSNWKSMGEFIHFMISNTNVAVRPLRTEHYEENREPNSTQNEVCIADHMRRAESERDTKNIDETKILPEFYNQENTSLEMIHDKLSCDETTSRPHVNGDNASASRNDITLNFLQVSSKDPKYSSLCYMQKGSMSFENDESSTDKSMDSNTTETSQTNLEESCEGKTSTGTSSCHSPPSVHRRSSIISSSSESELMRELEFLNEVNWNLQHENISLKKDMDDFDNKLEALEETLGIIRKVERTSSESIDGHSECSAEHSHDNDCVCDENVDHGEKTPKNANAVLGHKNFAQLFSTTCNQQKFEPQSFQDANIGARAPLHGLSNNHNNTSMSRRKPLDKKSLSKEVSVLKDNEKLMLSAIKSLHKCTTVHVRRHYDYRRMLKTCSKKSDTVTKKYESADTDLKEATNKFHEYRAKFFLEQDKREELSHSVSDLVKKMNNLRRVIRRNIEEKQNIAAHLDRIVNDLDPEVVERPDHDTLSQSMEIQMLKDELQKSRQKNQALEESLRIVRQYMDFDDVDDQIIFEVNRAAEIIID